MIVLGIDPDTKTAGIGIAQDGKPIYGSLVAVKNARDPVARRINQMIDLLAQELTKVRMGDPEPVQIDKIVVEGQTHRTGSRVRPQDLIHLAQVAGMAVGICKELWPTIEIIIPPPADWKGSIPKAVFTKKLLRWLNITYDPRGGLRYRDGKVRVPGTYTLPKAKATHVIDALGMARWGALR